MAENPKRTLRYAELLGKYASRAVGFELDDKNWKPFELSLRNTIMQQQIYQDLDGLDIPTEVVYGKFDMFVMKTGMQRRFKRSKHITFHEIGEFHRVSTRSAKLLCKLIAQHTK
jgi:hypothetical protein